MAACLRSLALDSDIDDKKEWTKMDCPIEVFWDQVTGNFVRLLPNGSLATFTSRTILPTSFLDRYVQSSEMLHAALLLLMLEAANARPRFTISLKRSTQNLQLSTSYRPITLSYRGKPENICSG
jgi:hypothetical protein